jgi:hypothetical protein
VLLVICFWNITADLLGLGYHDQVSIDFSREAIELGYHRACGLEIDEYAQALGVQPRSMWLSKRRLWVPCWMDYSGIPETMLTAVPKAYVHDFARLKTWWNNSA